MNETENTECVITTNTNDLKENVLLTDTTKISGIYKIINKVNGKYYVGSSNDILERGCGRFYHHKWMLKNNRHNNIHLQRAWNESGEKNFRFVIVKEVDDDFLLIEEQKYLDIAKKEKEKCYNFSFIAGKIEMTDETKHKIGEKKRMWLSIKSHHHMYGKHHSKETKKKISISNTGKKLSLIARQNISKGHMGVNVGPRPCMKGKNNPMYGKIHSNKVREKISNLLSDGRMKGINNGHFDKNIYNFLNKITDETFTGTQFDFYKKYNLSKSSVCGLLKGQLKSTKNWIINNRLYPTQL